MKKAVFISFSLIAGILIARSLINSRTIPIAPKVKEPTVTPVTTRMPPQRFVEVDGQTIAYAYIQAHPTQIRLFSNLSESTDSASAKDLHGCTTILNAGFYTKEGTHLGQFIQDSQEIHPAIQSNLADGFVWTDIHQGPTITYDAPTESAIFSLQTGPMVRFDNRARPLKLISDDHARRLVAGVNFDNDNFIFIVLYDPNALYSGPLLTEVPTILDRIIEKDHLVIDRAVNLDGGSASVWISPTLALTELTGAGGYFCIQSQL